MKIFFNEESHKYVNEKGEQFVSVTTLLKSLTGIFDAKKQALICARIGNDPTHEKYLLYKGMTEEMLLEKWRLQNAVGCEQGTKTHLWLEKTIKSCCSFNQYNLIRRESKEELIPVDAICKATLKPNVLINRNGIKKLMYYAPEIYYRLMEHYTSERTVLNEVLTFDAEFKIAGQIDLLSINQSNKTFVIDDWKTNNAPISKMAGYYKKDSTGNITDEFIPKFTFMQHPLSHLSDSKFNHYTMQLSMYAFLVEKATGYKCEGLRIYHIRNAANIATVYNLDVYDVPYLKNDCLTLLKHYHGR